MRVFMLLEGITNLNSGLGLNSSSICVEPLNKTANFLKNYLLNQTNDVQVDSIKHHNWQVFAMGIGGMILVLSFHRFLAKSRLGV
jgi:hypothetical protein